MSCLRHFNHKKQVWDGYDIITFAMNMDDYDINVTLNQNDKV